MKIKDFNGILVRLFGVWLAIIFDILHIDRD